MKHTLFFVFAILFFVSTSNAAQPEIWTINSRADVMRGEARSVSVDGNGTITPAPRLVELYKTEQPYIWSSAVDGSGNVFLGTGADGRIYKFGSNGSGSLFADLAELNVSALAIGPGGQLFAATSPDGKVYQIDSAGKAAVYFDPKEKYIWALAVMNDGSLAVGTGEGGKIFRVRGANAEASASLMFDTSETHITSLAADKAGNLYAGTDPNGLVLKFGTDGRPFGLLDSPLREIHELVTGPDGSVYVLAISESASAAKPSEPSASATPDSRTVTVAPANPAQPAPAQKSRYDLSGAKSAVYRILSDGGNDILWSSATVTGFALYAHRTGNGVLLGTSDRGRIYSIDNDASERLVLQSDASQISTIFTFGQHLYATSSNQGRLFRFGAEREPDPTYESPVLDAKGHSTWGNIWWASSGPVQIETRSGNSDTPNETWGNWQPVNTESKRGRVLSPAARYIQWRAKLRGSDASLREVSLAYLPQNIRPEITSLLPLPANVGLLANPPIVIDPNIDLSGQDPQAFGIVIAPQQPRRAYQRGARAFQWTAEDRNGDKLLFDVYYKESSEAAFKLVKKNLSENFVTLDGLSLADGNYVVKVVVKDSPSNPDGKFLTGERISESFVIDNSQPTVSVSGAPQITGDRVKVVFTASDRSSYITRAEYSVNGGEWRSVNADDGISDGPEERYTIEVPISGAGEISLTLRVFDLSGNIGNARAAIKK